MKFALGWIAIALTALFVDFNLDRASVSFLSLRVEMPLGPVVIGYVLVGAFAAYVFMGMKPSKK